MSLIQLLVWIFWWIFNLLLMNIGIMNSLYDPEAIGQTYEAVGPERITMVRIKYTVRPNKNSGIGILKVIWCR